MEDENLNSIINSLFCAFNITPLPKIRDIFRFKPRHLGQSLVDPVIVVKFDSIRDKVKLLNAVGEHRRNAKQPLCLNILGIDSEAPFYINEQLTKNNYEIFKEAMRLKKLKALTAVFTRNGSVHVKQRWGKEYVCVKNKQELQFFRDQSGNNCSPTSEVVSLPLVDAVADHELFRD